MAEIVRLKHITRQNNWKLYFYNGVVAVKNGIVELPADNFTRIRRAYLLGFRLSEDGQPISGRTHQDIVAQATVDSQEEQKSETRSSRGRQPRADNRIRQSESRSSGDTGSSGSQGVVHSGTGVEAESARADSADAE